MHSNYLILDLETTGLNPNKGDRIIEISFIHLKNFKVKEIFSTLLSTNKKISFKSYNINKISDSMLLNKPTFKDISKKIIKKIKKCILVTHNAKFDISFIKNELKLIGINLFIKSIDTLKISKKVFPGFKNNLLSLSKRFKIKHNLKLHRALSDTELLYRVFISLINFINKARIS